jgi:hypothetical protein
MISWTKTSRAKNHNQTFLENTNIKSMNCISLDLLNALLSGGDHRGQAEACLQMMSSFERSKAWMGIIPSLQNEGQCLLVAVLLRRDIANLSKDVLEEKLEQLIAIKMLQELIVPLLQLMLNADHTSQHCRRQWSHCLPEICASLSILSDSDCDNALRRILDIIFPYVSTFGSPCFVLE